MKKTVAHSEVHISKLISPSPKYPTGRVHAGEIMQLMYDTARQVATKHAGTNVTAIRVDEMLFLHPLRVGTVLTCHAYLTFTGKTSMDIEVNLYVEGLEPSKAALTSYFTMVALDEHHQPTTVPGLKLTTDSERIKFEQGKQRYALHHTVAKNILL
ncbi:acyl-CoA thioesterase [Pelosinus sp. sgz500959]|uniref:acyl-CoA thioesterase n=1 Tax=Pelosinus sp. sgz500959 TaxID=3242472 RepID=UPI0036710B1D